MRMSSKVRKDFAKVAEVAVVCVTALAVAAGVAGGVAIAVVGVTPLAVAGGAAVAFASVSGAQFIGKAVLNRVHRQNDKLGIVSHWSLEHPARRDNNF